MALSVDSKIKELKKNQKAVEIISAVSPGFSTDPQMKLVQSLTFRKLCSFPQADITPEQLEEIDAKLKAIED